MMEKKLVELIQDSITNNWDIQAMTNYKGDSVTYGDVGEKIASLHIIFEACHLKKGEHVALVGKNSVNWAITYLAVVTYGGVIVPVLPDFKPNEMHHIINHSDSKILFVADNIFEELDKSKIKEISHVFSLTDFSLLLPAKQKNVNKVLEDLPGALKKKFPEGFNSKVLKFDSIDNDELAKISYTSGTTGFTKGVMISHNNLVANIIYANKNMPLEPGDNIVSFLPLAHCYGCAFEFLWPFTLGCHITFLTKNPSPQVILQAFREIRPKLVLAVPLIIEKIYKKQILPLLNKSSIKLLLKTPVLNRVLKNKVRKKLTDVFGGNFHEIVIGGAPLNKEVEEFLNEIKFPFSIGYGMTECGPLISYANWDKTKLGSAGKVVDTLQIKIDSTDPFEKAGEIMVKGENVMKGYYKNPEETNVTFEDYGWMRTGDLGLLDKENFVFIMGRNKSMILGPSGQNIYPEEIEAKYNNMPYVQESLVIEKENKLIILIYPDYELMDKNNISDKELKDIFESHRKTLNDQMPGFMGISDTKIFAEEFEKTPKKSIKRFLYDNV